MGYSLIMDLKDYILLYEFAHFKRLRLFFLSNFPEATFIQGATSIRDSRVVGKYVLYTYPYDVFVLKHMIL